MTTPQRRARVILQNSHREAYGLAISEAMWKGAIVVASEVGGVSERLRHDHNGPLTRDTTGGEAWVATVGRALGDVDGRSRWSAAARRTVEDGYLLEETATRQLDLSARQLDLFARSAIINGFPRNGRLGESAAMYSRYRHLPASARASDLGHDRTPQVPFPCQVNSIRVLLILTIGSNLGGRHPIGGRR